eukprot:8337624-Pyramimonas_sp.AAC.1
MGRRRHSASKRQSLAGGRQRQRPAQLTGLCNTAQGEPSRHQSGAPYTRGTCTTPGASPSAS